MSASTVSHRRVGLPTWLLALAVAGLLPLMAHAATTINLVEKATTNGYKVTTRASETSVACQGVANGKAKLNGEYEVTVTFDDKTTETKKVTFTNGDGAYGAVPKLKTVAKVKVTVP